MGILLRESQFSNPVVSEAPGLLYAFVPAHGEAEASAVARELSRTLSEGHGLTVLLADFCARGFPVWGTAEAPQRLDEKSWGEFITKRDGFHSLEAREAHPREIPSLLKRARQRYAVTCADLTGARQLAALEVLRQSDSIFVVSEADRASVELARFKASWLRTVNLAEKSALLLYRASTGPGAAHAEDRVGLPVCGVMDESHQVEQLAAWLSAMARPCADFQQV